MTGAPSKSGAAVILFTAALVILTVDCSTAETPAIKILRHSLNSECHLSYVAHETQVVLVGIGEQTIVRNWIARSGGGSLITRCLCPSQCEGNISDDDGHWLRVYNPHTHHLTVTRSAAKCFSPHEIALIMRRICENYSVQYAGTSRAPGRLCDVVSLIPYSHYAHSRTIWVDRTTGLPLWVQVKDQDGHLLELTKLSLIHFYRRLPTKYLAVSIPKAKRKVTIAGDPPIHRLDQLQRIAGFNLSIPLWLPSGFEFDYGELFHMSGKAVACLRYNDGLSGISIYETYARQKRPLGYHQLLFTSMPDGEARVECYDSNRDFDLIGPIEVGSLVRLAEALDNSRGRAIATSICDEFRVSLKRIDGLRDRGLGFDTIAALLEISQECHHTLHQLLGLYYSGYNWEHIALRMHLEPYHIYQWLSLLKNGHPSDR
ncbi:MAG: hypothetical protein M1330_01240 [Armatimonadetes bacterium]|nr:hypothetical protein [Armatimonadota bacterium]